MSKQVRFRRGTTAQHSVFTGPAGEMTLDTDKKCLVVHDGVTAGGIPVARADRNRGWSTMEIFQASGTWTQSGKTDIKRIEVTAVGGGGGGNSIAGGGQGGIGLVILEASAITTTVAVTVGAGSAGTGGTTSFGTYVSVTGGSASSSSTSGAAGTASGTGVYNLGGQAGSTTPYASGNSGSHGGGIGGSSTGKGIYGSGGATGSGSSGCVIVKEIYGYV